MIIRKIMLKSVFLLINDIAMIPKEANRIREKWKQ